MGRTAKALTAARVRTAPPGRYGDGNGLYLLVRSIEARFWIFRYTREGRMREMGLGRAGADDAAVTLVEARERAAELHKQVKSGVDPLNERALNKAVAAAEAQVAVVKAITFRTVAERYLAAHEKTWRNQKHRMQWRNTLETYAHSHFGDIPVQDVGTEHVLSALEPIWRVKPETATRVRGRVESILDYATARDWRSGENPARWRGHLSSLLPSRGKVAPVEHHAALPWMEVSAFLPLLRAQAGVSARALEFTILTASRSGETLGARWNEIDLTAKLWIVPPFRMKGGREHRVPLSAHALSLLEDISAVKRTLDPEEFVFPGAQESRPLSIMAMTMVLRRMARGDLTVHGFRSTFRDWCGEATGTPREVAEAALAHALADKTEAAYARGDLFTKRRRLMEDWADYCGSPRSREPAVLPTARSISAS